MNIIPLFQSFVNHLSNILVNNQFLHEIEHNILHSTNELNLDVLKQILEYLDLEYKNSKERKEKYYVQQTRERTLITSLGLLTFDKTYYKYYASFCLLKLRKISMIKYLISLVIAGKYTPCLFGVKKYSWFKGLISDCLMILFLKKKDKEAVLEKYHLTVSGV